MLALNKILAGCSCWEIREHCTVKSDKENLELHGFLDDALLDNFPELLCII